MAEIFSAEQKEQILQLARDGALLIRREFEGSSDAQRLVNVIDGVFMGVVDATAIAAAEHAFKIKARTYIRELTMETVDRLLKLE
jgi:hypothetical protein